MLDESVHGGDEFVEAMEKQRSYIMIIDILWASHRQQSYVCPSTDEMVLKVLVHSEIDLYLATEEKNNNTPKARLILAVHHIGNGY